MSNLYRWGAEQRARSQEVRDIMAGPDRAPGEVETAMRALDWIADRAKYLAEPAWNLEGCALVGRQMYERANEALDALDAVRGRSRDDTAPLVEALKTIAAFNMREGVATGLPSAEARIAREALARFLGAGRPETQDR